MAKVQYNNDTSGKCTVTPDEYTSFTPNSTTITINASNGYHFTKENSPYLEWVGNDDGTRNSNMVASWFNRTLSADGKTITLIPTVKLSVKKNLFCKQETNYPIEPDTPSYPTVTINKNLNNVTMSPDVSSITLDGTSKVITLNVNQGYEFSGTPYFEWNREPYYFEQSGSSYIYDLNNLINENASITIYANATQIVTNPTVTINKNLTNVTMSPDVSSIELDGTSKVITLNVNQGYEFSGIPYFEWNREPYNFEQSGSSYIYDLNNLINENASITIYATGAAIAKTKDVTNQLTNCTITPEFNSMVEGNSYNLTLNANQGFKFVTTPTLSINNRDNVILDFNKVTDYQYTLSFTAESSYFDILTNAILLSVAVEETPIVNKYGAIQVYKPSTSDMSSLATKRFRANNTVDGVTFADIDLGSYITQFKRIFFDVDTNSKSNILLGVHDTQINTDVVNNDDVTIDCGTVILEGANGNELDTKIYKIKIVLPFYEVVELPSIYMNKTIHIVYQANVITGYADILINEVVDNTDLLIVKYRCKVSQDLPYILDYDKLNGALSEIQLNTSPKIILQKNNTFIDKGYTTYKEGLISNEVGYFEVKDIVSMSVNATQKEKDLIENLLKSGAYL